MPITAQRLVLDLLSATPGHALPVRALVEAAALFELTENNLRVTLARLLRRGLLERNERGQYRLAPGAAPVQRHVASWRELEARMVPWAGGWVGVHTAALSRGGRAVQRHRARAFGFVGFRELARGLYVRPDNLRGGVDDARARLYDLGLDAAAPAFAVTELDAATEARARTLWDVAALRRDYAAMRERLETSGVRLADLPLREALVEAFLTGGDAIRLLVFDPLLPEPIVPAAERRAVLDAMRRYDELGRASWARFMRARGAEEFTSVMDVRSVDVGALPAPEGSPA